VARGGVACAITLTLTLTLGDVITNPKPNPSRSGNPNPRQWAWPERPNRHTSPSPSCQAISSQLRHVSTIETNLLNSNISPTCAYNMGNFGLLAAEICWRVWGTSSKFQLVLRLDSVTARYSSSGRQPNFAALNKERHLYSSGRPSRWASAHILVSVYFRTVKRLFFLVAR